MALAGCTHEPVFPTVESARRGASMTDDELARAVTLARQEVRSEEATVTGAWVSLATGKVLDSNTGSPCTSGRLLTIQLIGSFPHIVSTGGPVDPGRGGSAPDFTVTALLLTADADSGRACLIGVQAGEVEPKPGATALALD